MKTKILILLLAFSLNSCTQEELEKQKSETISNIITLSHLSTLENGRLFFPNEEQFNQAITYYSERDNTNIEEFQSLYESGFKPLLRVTDGSTSNNLLHGDEKSQHPNSSIISDEDFDNLFEEYIADDLFASFLNYKGEIQVGDYIYKYTNRGLYFVHKEDIDILYKYLKKYSHSNIESVSSFSYDNTDVEFETNTGLTKVNDKINHFTASPKNIGHKISTDFNDIPYSDKISSLSDIDDLENFVKNLKPCSYKSGGLRSLFGNRVVCKSYFDSRRRIKTKFYNQDYYIVKRIGVVTKYQTRRFRIWWTNRTDEMALGINQVYFEYDIPTPNYGNLNNELYFFGGSIYNNKGHYIATELGKNLPALPFNSDLEIVVKLSKYGISDQNVSDKQINNLFWKSLWDTAKSVMRSKGHEIPKKLPLWV